MSKPQDEALDILKAVLEDFFSGSVDIKKVLRRCAHVCQILGWSERLTWFQNELSDYPEDVELPWYRKDIKGRTEWRVVGGILTALASVFGDELRPTEEPAQYIHMDVRAGIDWVLSAAQSGYFEHTGKKSSKYIKSRHKRFETNETNTYDTHVFRPILTNIENIAFKFVSESYAILCYGEALQEIWQGYRTKVDEHLMSIGFGGHLDTIRKGLNSDNPQDWRALMWSCRDVLCDMAAYLWQDPRETYEYLPGKREDGKLRVTQKEYVNRLGAYLHQRGATGEPGAYLRAEMERIYNSIKTLNELDSKAHDVITLHDARTAAVGTYLILGELVTRTDMKPLIEYQSP